MKNLILAAMIGLTPAVASAQSYCEVETTSPYLPIPKSGTSGYQWFDCMRKSFQSISTNTVAGGTASSGTIHTLYVDTIGGISTGTGVHFASNVFLPSNVFEEPGGTRFMTLNASSVVVWTPDAYFVDGGGNMRLFVGDSPGTSGGFQWVSGTDSLSIVNPVGHVKISDDSETTGWAVVHGSASISGMLGVGTSTPAAKVHISGGLIVASTITANGTGDNYFAGNVGIGTASPEAELHVTAADEGGTASIYLDADQGDDATDLVRINVEDGGILAILNSSHELMRFSAGGAEAVFNEAQQDQDFRVEWDLAAHGIFLDGSNGRVGINEASPGARLEVTASASDNYALQISSQNGTAMAVVDRGGSVGIGTTSPSSKLHVSSGTLHIDGTNSPTQSKVLCLNSGGNLSTCSDAPDASGNCTCS